MKLMDRPLVEALVLSATRETIAYATLIECIRLQAAAFIRLHPEGYNLVHKFTTDAMFGWPERMEAMSQAATTIRLITKSSGILFFIRVKTEQRPKEKRGSIGSTHLDGKLYQGCGFYIQ